VSLQAKIIKRLLPHLFRGWSAGTIEEQRTKQERRTRYARLPTGVRCQLVVADGVPAEWIEGAGTPVGAMLYLHGGAYVLGSIHTSRELVARLSRAAQVRSLAIDYRLAPEHPFPAALQDATTAYRWLLAQGLAPSQILLAGDSAGGGLALATLVALREAGEPLPAGAVCISPWTDLALTGGSMQSKESADPILAAEDLDRYAGYYAGAYERSWPLLSPFYADLRGLPPLLIQVGTEEILLDDAVCFAEKARQAGVDVTLEPWEGMFHVFQMVSPLPEAREAVERIAEFALQRLAS